MSQQQFESQVMKELHQLEEFERNYAGFIMNNASGDVLICNGDMLIQAMEDGYLYTEFLESMFDKD